jgi:outer membrane protein TolC
MAKTKDEDFVIFLNSAGEEVSNDPRWKAQQLLEAAGMSASEDTEELYQELDEARSQLQNKDAELEELRRQLEVARSTAPQGVEDLDEDDDESEDEDKFTTMSGKELQSFAKENGHDIKGLKTVGEVRARLRELTAGK